MVWQVHAGLAGDSVKTLPFVTRVVSVIEGAAYGQSPEGRAQTLAEVKLTLQTVATVARCRRRSRRRGDRPLTRELDRGNWKPLGHSSVLGTYVPTSVRSAWPEPFKGCSVERATCCWGRLDNRRDWMNEPQSLCALETLAGVRRSARLPAPKTSPAGKFPWLLPTMYQGHFQTFLSANSRDFGSTSISALEEVFGLPSILSCFAQGRAEAEGPPAVAEDCRSQGQLQRNCS